MSRHAFTCLLSGVLVACSPPSPIDAAVCPERVELGVLPRALAPPGLQTYWVGAISPVPDAGPTVVTLSVALASVGPQPINMGAFQIPVTTPGEFTVGIVASCEERKVGTLTFVDRVYPSMSLNRELPRECTSLAVVDAGLLDCDGVVIDLQGSAIAGQLVGEQTRNVDDARWVRNGNQLQLGSSVVAFSTALPWIAAEDFAIAGNSLALALDGGLVGFPFDAGMYGVSPYALCAARSDGAARVVAFCDYPASVHEGEPSSDREFVVCSLSPNGVDACSARRALFVRQEPESRRVLLRRDRQLLWLDLLSPETEVPALLLREAEFLGALAYEDWGTSRQPAIFNGGQVTPSGAFVTSEANPRVLVIEGDQRVSGSSQLLWSVDGGHTQWAWLP